MPTGACGINCDVCRLNLLGLCTSCGPGKSKEAQSKLATQERILGSTCPVLSCVVMNNKNYCIRDCRQFPCENHQSNHYPFSDSFLQMQKRRREHPVPQMDPLGKSVSVPDELWDSVSKRDLNLVSSYALSETDELGNISFMFLNQKIALDLKNKEIRTKLHDVDIPVYNPLLAMVALTYFNKIDRLYPIGKDLISSKDMNQSVYFQGINSLKKEPILRRFKDDYDDFYSCAKNIGGKKVDLADAAVVLYPFPRVPVYYLLWAAQDEYDPSISILFDKSIEAIFAPPIIWELVNLVNSFFLNE